MGLGWSRFSTLLEFCLDKESSESCEPIIIEALLASSNVIELYPRSDIPPAKIKFIPKIYVVFKTIHNKKQAAVSDVSVGVSRGYTDHYQGRGHSIRPTAALINIHEHLI